MKRLKYPVLLLLLSFFLLSCSSKQADDETGEKKKYLVATDTTFAPFEFEENGTMKGIDMDLLAAIAEDQGFQYDIKVLGFNAAVTAMEANQVDAVIAGMSITDGREKTYDFSDPYFESGVVMAVPDNSTIRTYEDLRGKKAAVKTSTEGSRFAESIKDKYGFEIKYFEDSTSMYDDLAVGNSAACFEDEPVIGYAVSQGRQLTIPLEREAATSYAFAVKKGRSPELIEMFNKGLANLRQDGRYQQIIDTYIKTNEE